MNFLKRQAIKAGLHIKLTLWSIKTRLTMNSQVLCMVYHNQLFNNLAIQADFCPNYRNPSEASTNTGLHLSAGFALYMEILIQDGIHTEKVPRQQRQSRRYEA